MIEQISSGRLPQISYSQSRNYTQTDVKTNDPESQFYEEEPERNTEETETKGTRRVTQDFASKRGKDKFALMMTVMATAHRLLITNTTLTRRSLYYDLKNERTSNLVPEQRCLDQAVHHVANLLNCAPWELSESLLFWKKFNFELQQISSLLNFTVFFSKSQFYRNRNNCIKDIEKILFILFSSYIFLFSQIHFLFEKLIVQIYCQRRRDWSQAN